MIELSLRTIAAVLGGEASGRQVLAPGPGHSLKDRSLSIKTSPLSPDGFIVHSFAGDSFQECRDYVKERLGVERIDLSPIRPPKPAAAPDNRRRIERAREIWRESIDSRGSIAEIYLDDRALALTDDIAGAILRFHPACPWRDEGTGDTIYVPAMIAAMRSVTNDQITAVQRTRLSPQGVKIGRRMLGIAAGTAIKLDADDAVTYGLAIGEGCETALAARQLGIGPVWALGSTNSVAAFPLLAGVECLTILAEHDEASAKAVQLCAQRWHVAGRHVLINRSTRGNDLNDALRGSV